MHDIAKFITGFKKFQEDYFCGADTLFSRLCRGQKPNAMLVACSDSRVDPAILTGCAPGELFIVRNVANLVPPYQPGPGPYGVSTALEYGVRHLEVEHIIVLGHCRCGGICCLLERDESDPIDGGAPDEFISKWMEIAEPAKRQVREELAGSPPEVVQRACEQAAILVSLDNLLTFPWIRRRAEAGRLMLHGWYFDMDTGDLLSYLPQTGTFEPLVPLCVEE